MQPNNLLTVCGILLVALVQRTALGDENWPQWRGPDARRGGIGRIPGQIF